MVFPFFVSEAVFTPKNSVFWVKIADSPRELENSLFSYFFVSKAVFPEKGTEKTSLL